MSRREKIQALKSKLQANSEEITDVDVKLE
jgi:hypothetical protein